MEKLNLNQIKTLLTIPRRIVITTHKSPDGDAMGSSLGLHNYLIKDGHIVNVITPNAPPYFLNWLPGNEKVLVFEKYAHLATKHILDAEVIFCLDFNNLSRIEEVGKHVAESKAIKILIDHHQQPDNFAHFDFHTVETSSTCELIYDFISILNVNAIDATIGECLYTGIMTDTASFRFSSSTADTHRKAADMISKGVNHVKIHEAVYDCNTYNRLQLMGFTLCNRFEIIRDLNTAVIWLSIEELEKYQYQPGDTEGFVNYGLSIEGVKLSAFFVERDGKVKVSFRSKSPFDVNQFSRNHFAGGGHKNAAGGESQESLLDTVTRFKKTIEQYRAELS